jgi:hypothetical protein
MDKPRHPQVIRPGELSKHKRINGARHPRQNHGERVNKRPLSPKRTRLSDRLIVRSSHWESYPQEILSIFYVA